MIYRTLLSIALFGITLSVSHAQLLPTTVTRPLSDIRDLQPVDIRPPKPNTPPLSELLPPVSEHLTPALEQALTPIDTALTLTANTVNGQTPLADINEAITPDGQLVLEREWVIYVDESDFRLNNNSDIEVLERQYLAALQMWAVRLKVAPHIDNLQQLKNSLHGVAIKGVDRNHVYLTQAGAAAASATQQVTLSQCHGKQALRIGMLDSAINASHPVFADISVTESVFLEAGYPVSQAHGTAVAGILSQALPEEVSLRLFNAAAFYARNQVSQGASVFHLLKGLNWLGSQQVEVINMSLTGPANVMLERALKSLYDSGISLVAAVGNAGPAAPPLYPAAYKQVIGVTAIDANRQIYRWANQGAQVAIAARGVSVVTARGNNEMGAETGTSMAAPLVSAAVGCFSATNDAPGQLPAFLRQQLTDLGTPGWDPVFGHGALLLN